MYIYSYSSVTWLKVVILPKLWLLNNFSDCNASAVYISLCICKIDTLSSDSFSINGERQIGKGSKNQGIQGFTGVTASIYELESLQRGVNLKAVLSIDPQPRIPREFLTFHSNLLFVLFPVSGFIIVVKNTHGILWGIAG